MTDIISNNEPHIVRVKDFRIDADYAAWLSEIKRRYHSAQIKASIKVNTEKLAFNWSVGRDLVMRKAEETWGSGVVEQLSFDLQESFPHDRGFSTTNLWAMKKWYLFFSSSDAIEKLHQLGGELQQANIQQIIKLHQLGGEIDLPLVLGLVPWRHQVNITTKCKSVDEAVFYLRECILGGWSRQTLDNSLKANLYKAHGKAISNFTEYLPEAQSRMAQEITKDNYDFGFVTVPANYKEEQLEAALEKNITRFLLELGTGFAFVGRQKELIVGGRTRRIDMLFYHIRLKAYVVVELKVKPFDPAYAGKLNYYVNAVDELLKSSDDNPTIGLLICSDKDETDVRWAFKGIQTPMGVASYDNVRIAPPSNLLPSAEELQARVRLVEKELNQGEGRAVPSPPPTNPHVYMKLDHIALYVLDLEAAKRFFVEYFGARANDLYHNPRTGLKTYFLSFAGGARLEIMQRPDTEPVDFNPVRQGYIHIAFSVGSKAKVDELTAQLARDGYEVLSGPRTTGDGYYESCIRAFENKLIELTE